MESNAVLYEALSPLSSPAAASPAGQSSPPPAPALVSSANSEPYVVFRNEVPLSTPQCEAPVLPEIVAADYFSLDLSADGDETTTDSFTTPTHAVTPAPVPEPEQSFEGGWFRSNCRFRSPMLQLHKEIIDFCNFLSPTEEEKMARKAAVERVSDVIHYIWANCKVEVFGSFRTGLYLPTSDVDVVILGSDIRTPQLGLHALARALSQRGIAKKMQVIAKARVPIVKFVEKKSGIPFDISFDLQNGPMAADFIKDAVSKWAPLRPLCLILKVFLQQRELNEVYTGGIGSYALLTMLIAMLRSVREQHSSPEHNLGVLLVNFFDIYGRKLNTSDVGVSCNGTGTFFSKNSRGFLVKGRPFLIAIEDPQAPENDIGKSSFSYFQVRSAFSMAFSTLTNSKTIFGLGSNRSILGTIIRPDSLLSGRKGGSNGEVTFDNLLPGAGEPLPLDCADDDEQEISCNWQLYGEEEEEPLPRGSSDHIAENGSKKRKAYKEKNHHGSSSKKFRENGEAAAAAAKVVEHDEGGSSKGRRSGKKQRWRHYREENRRNRSGGSPWSRTS